MSTLKLLLLLLILPPVGVFLYIVFRFVDPDEYYRPNH